MSSVPVIVTSASAVPGLISRSRLTWSTLPPGFMNTARCTPAAAGAVSCSEVTKPSDVRAYESTSISRSLDSSRRQEPAPGGPTPTGIPLSMLPDSKSSELNASPCPRQWSG